MSTKITLHTAAFNGGPFNCQSAREIELDAETVLANNVIFAGEFNPHNCRLWVIGNEFGAIGAVWADCEQDAFDELCDAGLSGGLACDEADTDEAEDEISRLGNAGEPHDLSHAWIQQVTFDPARDIAVMLKFAEARGANVDTLDGV